MADVNVNAPADQAPTMAPPTRTDDQILPHIRWVPIGKSNCYLDVEKSQSNPIYKIAFLDTVRYDKTVGCYKCQPDEQWFDLIKDTLRDSLQITPVNRNKAFSSPPSSDALIKLVNEPGYPKLVKNLSNVEEFTQSIHTFIEDKKNLAQHTYEKKKATLIVIPSIRFTKLIIYHLQRKHKFYPRPDSPLHLPNEEPVLGYLKFNAKGTKREVFGMHIPGNLITTDIQGEPYYQEYLAKVAKHQRYLFGKQGSDPDSPALKPTKATKKSKLSAPKADLRPPVSKPASSQQPEPKPAPAKSQGKKLDESVAEGIPEKEPRVDDEEVDVQRALEESLKIIYDAPQGPLPPVVIREPESGKYQPLPEVQGKGKEKVTDEHVACDLLTLQTLKKKSPADQYIFQRRTSTPTGSFGHDESSSLYAELWLTDSEVESDEDVPGINAGVQGEGQAGPNPDDQDEGQAEPNPGDAAASQPLPSPVVHVRPNLEHMDLEVTNVSTQPHLEQMDEGFTATAYPKKTAETEAESMVSVTIQQDTSSIPPMITPIIDLTSRPESPNVHQPLQATATETTTTRIHPSPSRLQQSTTDSIHGERLYTLENLDIPQQVSKVVDEVVIDAVNWAIQGPLRNCFRDLPEADMKEILHQRMWETNSYKTHEDHMMLYEALEKSPPHQPPPPQPPAGPSGASGSPKASGSSQVLPPPPPPLSTNQKGQSHGSIALSSSKTAASTEYKAWTMTDTRLRLSVSSTPEDLQIDDDMAPDAQAQSSNDEDIGNANIPKNNWASALASTYSPPLEDSLPAQTGDIAMFMDWFCKRQGITELKPQDLEGPAFELVKVFHPNTCVVKLEDEGGLLLWCGLEQMVPDQMWIEEECKHTSEGDRRAVRTHMRILSIVRIEVFSMYGYDYIKKTVLRRADLNEYIIAERDFKYLHPSDFEDLYLLNLQGHLNHLLLKDKKILTTADATGFEYKHDYTTIDSLRAVIFRDRYGVQMIMRFNEIHKFSDGTVHQINEALDHRVKEFKVNKMNPVLNTRFWTRKDVDRSKEFMFAIQKRLKTRRIFRNLESFVGGRVRDGDYRLLKRTE
nr:E-beta-farnesene synthase [Tanacetum cinerariifolium]